MEKRMLLVVSKYINFKPAHSYMICSLLMVALELGTISNANTPIWTIQPSPFHDGILVMLPQCRIILTQRPTLIGIHSHLYYLADPILV